MLRYAVFLRAINTGRRRVKMADLAAAYRDAKGAGDVTIVRVAADDFKCPIRGR